MRHILLILFLVTHYSVAEETEMCNNINEQFILSSIEQSEVSKPYSPFEIAKEFEVICEVKNPIMMDGLAFQLYKNTVNSSFFIGLYNGLDGSNQLHGPFDR
ncbi:hypothetical protein [Pseudoalteromonas rhizosphaerae]|uniref:hypothetical protein n=1 Tax=Pseudoalteromonas rhizosphaerae TaxID=2518973 RepID=UPI00123126CC|nr:hypothetical protein [Pseudoalteromonas rhizosphaerae]